ncbi:uroporphyrinogen-III C-methyltransferase [Alicyclobacillus shizuokensis]|uniref:uroporphyrinogen-III C-methyltransferase n=1 Tax=Alicyclobacillus shizuokensis TaxID=392014 RepID=UPI00082F5588|nr:uroporphyrinogen-III C-methyltransferase [Alicyclobacillus shizuokensis]
MGAEGAGKVYLVGAGPGAAGLLTVRARRLLAKADAVVYDRLLSPRLLAWTRSDCRCIYVGKRASLHTLPQADIQRLLIGLAKAGATVVRLKGGDPFVFGRGGEEALALSAAGIDWELVPGVTSAVSVPAYAGIPVTHRRVSAGFTVETGHRGNPAEGNTCAAPDSASPSPLDHTRVVLMGVGHLPQLVENWLGAGWPAHTRVAVVGWGTRAQQRVVDGTLVDIVDKVRVARVGAPAVIVVGDTVGLRSQLAWAERLPLFGRRLLVMAETRELATDRADELEDLGAEVYEVSLEHVSSQRLPANGCCGDVSSGREVESAGPPAGAFVDGSAQGEAAVHGVWEALRRETAEYPLDAVWVESTRCLCALQAMGIPVAGVPVLWMRPATGDDETSGPVQPVLADAQKVAQFLAYSGQPTGAAR